MAGTAFLVLDLQRDFLEARGRMPIDGAQVEPLLVASNALIDRAAMNGAPVVYIVNAFPPSQWFLNVLRRGAARVGTYGAEMDPRVHIAPGGTFTKDAGDAFTNPALGAFLRERAVERLLLGGVFAPACVRATLRGALREGYGVTVVRDCVGASSDRARDRGLAAMADDGATLASAEGALALL